MPYFSVHGWWAQYFFPSCLPLLKVLGWMIVLRLFAIEYLHNCLSFLSMNCLLSSVFNLCVFTVTQHSTHDSWHLTHNDLYSLSAQQIHRYSMIYYLWWQFTLSFQFIKPRIYPSAIYYVGWKISSTFQYIQPKISSAIHYILMAKLPFILNTLNYKFPLQFITIDGEFYSLS
jgi:hypothetical protein